MSEQPQFFSYTREEFLDEFVHPDDRPAVDEARQKRALHIAAQYLTDMRKKAPVPCQDPRGCDQQFAIHSMAPTSRLMMSSSSVRLRAAARVPASYSLSVRHRAGARHSGSSANAATHACANRASGWAGPAKPKCSA